MSFSTLKVKTPLLSLHLAICLDIFAVIISSAPNHKSHKIISHCDLKHKCAGVCFPYTHPRAQTPRPGTLLTDFWGLEATLSATVAGFDYNGVKVLGVRGPALRAGVEVNDIVTHLTQSHTALPRVLKENV